MSDSSQKKGKKKKPNIKLGLTLRALREYSNLSLEDAASLSGLSSSKISRFENGVYTPTKTQLMHILSSYGSLNLNEIHEKKRQIEALKNEEPAKERKKTLEDLVKEPGHRWQVFSDGSSIPNPGKGAWAYVILCDGDEAERKSGFSSWTTNNEMELTGMVNGLERLFQLKVDNIEAVSDSQYVVLGITEWIDEWRTDDPKLDHRPCGRLWMKFLEIRNSILDFTISWTRGHSGQKWNELCDSLCESEYYIRGLPDQTFFKGRYRSS